jgi:hypothetical protein
MALITDVSGGMFSDMSLHICTHRLGIDIDELVDLITVDLV